MNKLTKRKGFNFFRSYFDVYNELENNEDKVAFIDALLDRQFMGIKPTNLKGMAKFAYISQTNSIDSQVKGYEDKTGIILTPIVGGCLGGKVTPTVQVEVKEKVEVEVEVKEKNKNNDFFNELLVLDTWLESTAMQSTPKFNIRQVKDFLKKYNDMLNVQFEVKINKREYCTHFINWLNKQSNTASLPKRVIS